MIHPGYCGIPGYFFKTKVSSLLKYLYKYGILKGGMQWRFFEDVNSR